MNSREHHRKAVKLTGTFTGEDTQGRGRITNLSVGGCSFESQTLPAVGAFMEATIQLDDLPPPLKINVAVVRWVQNQEFGLEFINLQSDEKERLHQYISTADWMRRVKGVFSSKQ